MRRIVANKFATSSRLLMIISALREAFSINSFSLLSKSIKMNLACFEPMTTSASSMYTASFDWQLAIF